MPFALNLSISLSQKVFLGFFCWQGDNALSGKLTLQFLHGEQTWVQLHFIVTSYSYIGCNLVTLQLLYMSNVNSNCALCADTFQRWWPTTIVILPHNIREMTNWSDYLNWADFCMIGHCFVGLYGPWTHTLEELQLMLVSIMRNRIKPSTKPLNQNHLYITIGSMFSTLFRGSSMFMM